MIWKILKKSAIDAWDELLMLVTFNLLWFVGALLIVPYPFLTFALFFTARDVTEGRGIKFGNFFGYGRTHWKQAYIWGAANLAILLLLWFNVTFYAGFGTQWALVMQLFFVALIALWLVLQLTALAIYPRLVEPGYALAQRNAAVLVGRHPLVMLVLLLVCGLLAVGSAFLPALFVLITVSLIAVLTTNTVDLLLARELAEPEEEG